MERQSSKFGLRTVAIVGGGACKFRDFVFQARVFGCAVLDAVLVVLDAVLVVLEAVLVGNGQPPSHGVGHGAEVVGVGTVGTVGAVAGVHGVHGVHGAGVHGVGTVGAVGGVHGTVTVECLVVLDCTADVGWYILGIEFRNSVIHRAGRAGRCLLYTSPSPRDRG